MERSAALEAVMDSLAIYLIASIAAYYLVGLRSPGAANRLTGLTSTFGIVNLRVFFPFSGSMVTAPVLASAYLCWAVPRLATRRLPMKPLKIVGACAAVFAILAAEYRMPIFILLAVLVVGSVRPKLLRFAAVPMAALLLLLPFWWNEGKNPVYGTSNTLASQAGTALQRQDAKDDFETLDNRTYLWKWAEVAYDRSPLTKQLLGWGHAGQVRSGAADGFFAVARGFTASRNGISAHSTAWQTLLDGGLLGLLVVASVVLLGIRAARSWCPSGQRFHVLLSPLLPLLALISTSGTEVTLAPGIGSEVFFVYLLLVGVSIKRPAPALLQLPPTLASSNRSRIEGEPQHNGSNRHSRARGSGSQHRFLPAAVSPHR